MQGYLIIFLGAGVGGALRHGVNLACARACGLPFPWGTLTVNVVGSSAMGLIAAWLAFKVEVPWSQHTRLFVTTGILGGFTTFSAFSTPCSYGSVARRSRHWAMWPARSFSRSEGSSSGSPW
jgi:CrcB protein